MFMLRRPHRVLPALLLAAASLLPFHPALAQTPEQWKQICGNSSLLQALLAPLQGENRVEAELETEHICAQINLPDTPVHDTADPSREATHTDEVLHTRYSADGRTIASAGRDGTVRLWDAETGLPIRTIMVAENDPFGDPRRAGIVGSVEFLGDGTRLAAASHGNPVRLIERSTGDIVDEIVVSPHDHGGTITAGGGLLFGGGHKDSVDAYDPTTLAIRYSLPGHDEKDFAAIAVSEAAGLVATAHGPGNSRPPTLGMRFWRLDTGEFVNGFIIEGTRISPKSLAFSRDGTRIAFGMSGSAYVYSVADRTLLQKMFVHPIYRVNTVAFTADGAGLITCQSHPILWDIDTGEKLRHFGPFRDICESVDVSPDGRFAVTTSRRSELRIWEIETGTFYRRLGGNPLPEN